MNEQPKPTMSNWVCQRCGKAVASEDKTHSNIHKECGGMVEWVRTRIFTAEDMRTKAAQSSFQGS